MLPILSAWGTTCEYAIVQDENMTIAPENLNYCEAASLPLVGLTVLQALEPFLQENDYDVSGKKILIQGGAGGLGSFCIQYCKNVLHMMVYATCNNEDVKLLTDLGADVLIDYENENFEKLVRNMDAVFDSLSYLLEEKTMKCPVLKKVYFYILYIINLY
jgi:alcohol dehydrogenase